MKAIILAARRAPRLLPLTEGTPQCMLKMGKKTILEMQVEKVRKAGVKDIVVIVGYLSEKLEKFCKELGVRTLFNPFYGVSGMALALWVAKEELKGDFIFFYSDVMFDDKVVSGLLENKRDICLAVKKDGLREEAEKVIEKEGLIKDISKSSFSEQNGEFIGLAKFSASGAKRLVKGLDSMAREDLNAYFIKVIDSMIAKGEMIDFYDVGDARYVDIDFPEDLKRAEKIFG